MLHCSSVATREIILSTRREMLKLELSRSTLTIYVSTVETVHTCRLSPYFRIPNIYVYACKWLNLNIKFQTSNGSIDHFRISLYVTSTLNERVLRFQ